MLNSMLGIIETLNNPQYIAKERIFQLAENGEIISKCPWWIDGGRTGKQNAAKSDAKYCVDKLKEYGVTTTRIVVDLDRGILWKIP